MLPVLEEKPLAIKSFAPELTVSARFSFSAGPYMEYEPRGSWIQHF